MNTLSATTSLITHSLAWALLYSLWQGALISGTLYALLRAIPNATARIKYYLSFSAFTGLFLWFADTWLVQYQKLKGVTVYITQSAQDGGISKTFSVNTFAGAPVHETGIYHMLPRLEHYFPFMLLIYAIGLAFMLCRFAINIVQARGLRTAGLLEAPVEWSDMLSYWQDKLEIARTVKLYLSERVNAPMMLGALKPIILLPVATMNHLTVEQVEAILMHELAHIKRHDYLLNIFQNIAETILFFNPFVWLISRNIRREREHCCDDMVVAGAANPLPYARALAILENNRASKENKLALAATGPKNQLFHRIKRIMEMKKNNVNYSQLTIIIVAIIAISFSIAMFTFTPSFAQKAKNDNADTTTKTKSVYKYRAVTIDSNGKKTEIVKESDKPLHEDMNEDSDVVTVNISGSDDSDEKRQGTKKMVYSYSYSNNGDDDLATAIAPVARITIDEIAKEMDAAQKELSDVDWSEIKAEIKKSLAEIDKELNDEKMNKEISIEVRKGLEKGKEALEKAEKEMQKSRQMQVEVRAKAGKGSMAPVAKAEIVEDRGSERTDYEEMLNKMEHDRLIDRTTTYRVEKKKGGLYINSEKQPESVYNQYSEYLKDKSVSIKGHKGSLSISVDN